MRAMVLAAGVGSRLDPLTSMLPKPLVPVANIPVMEHILGLLARHGFTDVVANLHYMPEKIESYFGATERHTSGIKVELRREEKLSGDAGGVRFCKDFFSQGTFVVLMGDLLTDADLTSVLKAHKEKGALATIALKQVADVSHFGVAVLDREGFIKGFQEKPCKEEALSNLASTGIYVLEPEIFDYMPTQGDFGFGRQLFPKLIAMGLPVLGCEITDYWSDVGTIEQYLYSNFDVLAGKLEVTLPGYRLQIGEEGQRIYLAEGVVLSAGARIDGNAIIGENAIIGDGVQLKGNVIIGANSVIGAHACIFDSILWSGTSVEEHGILRGAICAGGTKLEVAYDPKFLSPKRTTQVLERMGTCV
jgi:NDP-sugar pyrophosphorylase family protein